MLDEKTRTENDRYFISLEQDYEVRNWAKALGCSQQELREAVAAAGNHPDNVRRFLRQKK